MKRTYILLAICCALVACKKQSVDFSYKPAEPRAGESVTFSNLSTDGEEWEWDFGDGTTSSSKSPIHTFKRANTYRVTLRVDGKSYLTRTHEVQVFDTVPSFTLADTTVMQQVFVEQTYKAQVYNPYNYTLSYAWSCDSPNDCVVLSDNAESSTYSVYYRRSGDYTISLEVVIGEDTTRIGHTYTIADRPAPTLLMRTSSADYAQRVFGSLAEDPQVLWYAEGSELLDRADETAVSYNGHTFTLSELSTIIPGIQGFAIAGRRLYYRTEVIYVSNMDGSNAVLIDPAPTRALSTDMVSGRLYWALDEGVRYMPLVTTENNRFDTSRIVFLNHLEHVVRMTPDSVPR